MLNKEHPALGLSGPGPGAAARFLPGGTPWLVLVAWWVVKRPRAPTGRLGARTPAGLTLTFVLVSQSVLTTSIRVVVWPQGDQFLGGGHKWDHPILTFLGAPF